MENWKEIKGYEGLYEVSSEGRIRIMSKTYLSGRGKYVRRVEESIMKPSYSNGYQQVTLSKDKLRKSYKVHRLVADAFIPNPDNLPCIDHINTVRTDNRVDNLRWCSHKDNSNNPITMSKYYGRQTRLGSHPTEETLKKLSESHKGKHWTTIQGKRVWY